MNSKTKLIALVLALALVLPFFSDAAVRVRGYTRKDGTYVQPHYRSNPDGNPYNNYSFPGNTNPYTGKVAPGNPDTYLKNYYGRSGGSSYSLPSYSTPSYAPSPTPSYSLPSYSTPSPAPSYSAPSYLRPSYSLPTYTSPSYSSFSGRQKMTIYRKAKEAVDLGTGCNSSGLNTAEIADCFRYAYNKESFDWEPMDYSPPQPQAVSQPSPASASTPAPISQTASVISPYTSTDQKQTLLILQLQLQIAALQAQLDALRRR